MQLIIREAVLERLDFVLFADIDENSDCCSAEPRLGFGGIIVVNSKRFRNFKDELHVFIDLNKIATDVLVWTLIGFKEKGHSRLFLFVESDGVENSEFDDVGNCDN